MRSFIKRQIYRRVTSAQRRDRQSDRAEAQRKRRGEPRRLEYFHRFGDPASALMAPLLAELAQRYDVEIAVHLTGRPDPAVTPEPEQLDAYARADAQRLAARFGLDFADPGRQPDPARVAAAEAALAARLGEPDALDAACELDGALWRGEALPATQDAAQAEAAKRDGDARRDRLGHFQSGTVHYAGQWYWGADRLHYLQARLESQGARREAAPREPVAPALLESQRTGDARGVVLEIYPSLRSPYTYLAMERAFALARRWNGRPEIRFVLPMVMRKLPVPRRKGVYFLKDAKREAERLDMPFGDICDPLGRPTERGLAVLHHAIEIDRGEAFLTSFLKGVWADGIDAGTDAGLCSICERAGIAWSEAKDALDDERWRSVAEANRERLAGLGLWGVPSFRVGQTAIWGQDRLFAVEEALASAAQHR